MSVWLRNVRRACALGLLLASVPGVRAEVVVLSDDFDRVDGPSLGTEWDDTQGAPQQFGISSNTAAVTFDQGSPGGPGFALISGFVVPPVNFSVDVDIDHLDGPQFSSIVFAYVDDANYWELRARGSANTDIIFQAELIQIVAGVETANPGAFTVWDFDTVHAGFSHLDVDYDGTTLTVGVSNPSGGFTGGGTQFKSDTVALAEGQVGLKSRAGELHWVWDNFQVTFETSAVTPVSVEDVLAMDFISTSGVIYRLEASADLTVSNGFADAGTFVVGSGTNESFFIPAEDAASLVHRIVTP